MDYYSILGVKENASQDEIKKAYKKLAMQHHPDRGGDTKKFQEISQAYDTLGDAAKRSDYDAERNGMGNTQFHFHTGNPFDPFSQMFGGRSPFEQFFNQGQRVRQKNRDLNIRCTINFKQSFLGTELEATYMLPSGKPQTVTIKVPPGVEHGQTIRYSSMGDDSVPNLPRGDLNVTILVEPLEGFERRGDDIVMITTINAIEAMVGCNKLINTLDDNTLKLALRPGTRHGSEFLNRGLGFKNIASGYKGNLIVRIHIDVPAVTDRTIKQELESIYAKISNPSRPNP